ncbi:MAG: VWA domain-containing protein [Kofleriaceae bacterium]|nr:VWA domain-containing protein [Kofleriaceae bacterium]
MGTYKHAFALLASLAMSASIQAGCVAGLQGNATVGVLPIRLAPTPIYAPSSGQASLVASASLEISFFGVPLAGADDVVFVLDRSGSMSGISAGFAGRDAGLSKTQSLLAGLGGSVANAVAGGPLPTKLEAAKEELIRTLRSMPDGTRVGVIFFDSNVSALAPTMWSLSPDTRHRAEMFIRGIEAGGSTAAVPAMRSAYRMGARRIVLLSDGLANSGGSGGDLLAQARGQIQSGLRIDTVGLGIDQDDGLLRSLAAESGGVALTR